MSNNNGSGAAGGGIGLAGLVFAAFLVCKLGEITAIQHWSWWWVCSPLWIPFGVVAAVFCLIIGIGIVVGVVRFVLGMDNTDKK